MNNNVLLLLMFLVFTLTTSSIFSSMHNIDLSWNARYIDMVDCNGFVCEDIEDIYIRSIMSLYFLIPLDLTIALSMGYLLAIRQN